MKRPIKAALIVLGILVGAYAALMAFGAYFWWSWGRPVIAFGSDAEERIRSRQISVPENADAFYWFQSGKDHTFFCSFNVPRGEVRERLRAIIDLKSPGAGLVSGATSEFTWINEGPDTRPRTWKDHYWNTNSLANAVMYEERYRFYCADLETGRIYLSTWSE